MCDEDIIKYFYINNHININKTKLFKLNKINKNIVDYLNNRFDDQSDSYIEIINRIKYHIEIRPICPICGNRLKWITKNKYQTYCSYACKNKDLYKQIQQKSIEHYGSSFNRDQFKETILTKFGQNNWCNRNKQKETIKNHTCEQKQQIETKKQITKFNKYNDKYYNNRLKAEQTCLKHYGVLYYFQTDECKNKSKLAYLYNKEYIDNKRKQTCIEKYGYAAFNLTKSKQTKLEKYGDEYYNNHEQYINTCLEKYGVPNIFCTLENKNKAHATEAFIKYKNTSKEKYGYEFPIQSPIIQQKIFETKRKNNSFNISKPEEESYILLKEKYPDVIRQYRDDRYPFACDFYIPSLDLFIECNYHWTHGNKQFEDTEEDKLIIGQWKEKNTIFYNNAISTWTIRDTKKREIAKERGLNYLEFFNFKDFQNWMNLNT